jgi:prolipoprotein diacylglyceryltransferase
MTVDIILICIGVLMIVLNKPLSRFFLEYQRHNLSNYQYGEKELRGTKIALVLIGIGAIIIACFRVTHGT